MTVGNFFDKTIATRVSPGTVDINEETGAFVQPSSTMTTIRIHVTSPKLNEALPAGVHIQQGDVIIHADTSHGLAVNEVLEFWNGRWRLVTQLRQYDVLDSVAAYKRRSYLARRLGEADNTP